MLRRDAVREYPRPSDHRGCTSAFEVTGRDEVPRPASLESAIYTLNVKVLSVPLFGILDAKDQEPFHAAFARAGASTPLTFDAHAFGIIEHQLELDAEQLLPAVHRYVMGQLRPSAQGIRGWHLGDFGEALVLVLHLLRRGWDVSRVVSSHGPNGAERPMPDFWATDSRGQLHLIEVKASEALDYQELSQSRWKWLSPCRNVGPLRSKALRQLGFDKRGQDLGFGHALEVLGKGRNKFPLLPARKGVAWAVLAYDGRMDGLRGQKRFKTPPACSAKGRDCWACLGRTLPNARHDVLAVELPNAPGRLPLLPPGEGGQNVFGAYRRWADAIWAAEVTAIEETSSELAFALLSWIAEHRSFPRFRARMRREWHRYIVDTAAERGVASAAWVDLARIADLTADTAGPASQRNGAARVIPPSEVAAVLQTPVDERSVVHVSTVFRTEGDDFPDTISLRSSPQGWSARVCSRGWWSRQNLDGRAASDLVRRVLGLLVGYRDLTWHETSPMMLPVFAEASDSRVELGWRLVSTWEGAPDLATGAVPEWIEWLSSGDPRARLYVFKDGRLSLSVRGELPRQVGPPPTLRLPELSPPTLVTPRRAVLVR